MNDLRGSIKSLLVVVLLVYILSSIIVMTRLAVGIRTSRIREEVIDQTIKELSYQLDVLTIKVLDK